MRVVMISFDSLEYSLVEKYNCKVLMQKEYGKINLDPYLNNRPAGRGSGEPFTPDVYGIFISGTVPGRDTEDFGTLKRGFDTLYSTIFKLAPLNEFGRRTSLDVDVPAYGGQATKSWIEKVTGFLLFSKYWRDQIPLERVEEEYYKYMDMKASYADLIRLLGYDLVLFYFKEPDKLQHIWNLKKQEPKFRKLYRKCEDIAEHIINTFSDKETLFIIFSDHGTTIHGWHSQYGFWSSNKSLEAGMGEENSIDIDKWYDIIKRWYELPLENNVPADDEVYTKEEREKIVDHLKNLGYLG